MNKWKNIGEIKQSLKWLGLLETDDEFISKILDIENCGTCKYGGSSSLNFTYELHHDNKSFEVVFSKDKKNNYTLKRINNIPFNVLKCTRCLMQWAYLKSNLKEIDRIPFLDGDYERVFDQNENKFINYIAEVFYRRLFSNQDETPEVIQGKQNPKFNTLPNIITYLVTHNKTHFKSCDSYIVMDSLLTHNGERVFCIFDKNKIPNKQPYILTQICTVNEIIYDCAQNKSNKILSTCKECPDRSFNNNDDKIVTFKKGVYRKKSNFWSHITSDRMHWQRLKPIYKKYCESTGDQNREKFREYFMKEFEDKIENLIYLEKSVDNNHIGIYIENLKDVFFPNITNSVYMEIEFFGKKYYIVLSYDKGRRGNYSFTPKTFFTEELYRKRIKIE